MNALGLPSATGPAVSPVQSGPIPSDFWGQAPWYQVPPNSAFMQDGWPVSVDKNGNIFVTEPFSGRRYACRTNEAYFLVYQSLPTVC